MSSVLQCNFNLNSNEDRRDFREVSFGRFIVQYWFWRAVKYKTWQLSSKTVKCQTLQLSAKTTKCQTWPLSFEKCKTLDLNAVFLKMLIVKFDSCQKFFFFKVHWKLFLTTKAFSNFLYLLPANSTSHLFNYGHLITI